MALVVQFATVLMLAEGLNARCGDRSPTMVVIRRAAETEVQSITCPEIAPARRRWSPKNPSCS
jgi:hypothetical protein